MTLSFEYVQFSHSYPLRDSAVILLKGMRAKCGVFILYTSAKAETLHRSPRKTLFGALPTDSALGTHELQAQVPLSGLGESCRSSARGFNSSELLELR